MEVRSLRNFVGSFFMLGLIAGLILDVVGWWVTLFLWIIPTLSLPLGEILSLSLGTIVAMILYFFIWLPMMVYGVVIVFAVASA